MAIFGNNAVIDKVFNPLKVTKSSLIEFNVGLLANKGMYLFKKIIEFNVEGRIFSRYLIYSKAEKSEYVFEAFPDANGVLETYLYKLIDTVPFSEEFMEVAGQRYLTTPDDIEYERCIMPDNDDRVEGVLGTAKIFDIQSDSIEKEIEVTLWDYQREFNSRVEYLNLEMRGDTGVFRIFAGEIIEDIFYKFYQTSGQ